MPHAIDRLGRPAAGALAGAVLMVLFGLGGTAAATDLSAEFRLAQASGQKAPKQAAAPVDPVEKQLADLQKRLAITPQQQPQFDAFAQAVRQNAQEMNNMMQQEQQKPTSTAVEGLRSSAQAAQLEADGLKRLLPPLEALYATLSDQQKRAADQALNSPPGNQGPPQQQPRKKG